MSGLGGVGEASGRVLVVGGWDSGRVRGDDVGSAGHGVAVSNYLWHLEATSI